MTAAEARSPARWRASGAVGHRRGGSPVDLRGVDTSQSRRGDGTFLRPTRRRATRDVPLIRVKCAGISDEMPTRAFAYFETAGVAAPADLNIDAEALYHAPGSQTENRMAGDVEYPDAAFSPASIPRSSRTTGSERVHCAPRVTTASVRRCPQLPAESR